ncbi:MAG TPA: hypothetical protein VEO01_40215 [Pseudonocardiaceae bacterium]|nr:hypothetical protein [Pseudonocardiaceae bacterium]
MAESTAQFNQVRGEVEAELNRAREEFAPLNAQQLDALAEHYRSGAAGPELRDLQRRVDLGETTWDDIKTGRADPPLVQAYLRSQSKLGQLVKAGSEGRDMDEFFEEQHRLGHHFAAARDQAPPARRDPVATTHPDDEDFDQQSWLK